jgi:class 3 adenylate cyclase
MPEPRPHTRAFLFADLRGYSAFAERRGDEAAAQLIGRYRRLVRERIAAFDGAEIRTEGDSFYVVFDSVSQAVEAGLAIREAAAGASDTTPQAPIHVGIGVHAGESTDGEQGIVSSAVNIAARVCAVAEPGEVLVTDTVRGLTRTFLAVRFTPRGRHRLKGIPEPIHLFAVDGALGTDAMPAAHRYERRLLLAAGVAGAVAMIIGIVLIGSRLPSGTGRAPLPSVDGAATAVASPVPAGSATPEPFPSDAERALLDRLPNSVAASCQRADPDAAPVYEDVAHGAVGEFPLAINAGLSCLTESTQVTYWQATTAPDVDAVFLQEVGRRRLPSNDCGAATRAWQEWESGISSGKLLCYSATNSLIWWTYDDTPVLAIASPRGGDIYDLLDWWRDKGRLLSH